nr:unnamed protein product [Callosobruchus analis]
MVLTRELRDEIKSSVSSCISSALKDDDFIKAVVKKVTDVIVKTLGERISELEEKIERIRSNYSTVVNDLKEETALLKSENDLLLKRMDDLDQESRTNSLRIFNFIEKPQENLYDEVSQLIHSKLGISIRRDDIFECRRIGEKNNSKPRSIILKLSNVSVKRNIYDKKRCLRVLG